MNLYKITWRDIGKALLLSLLGNIIVLVMSLPEDHLPTLAQIKSNLITSVKFTFLPYLLKNFFTDSVKAAEGTLIRAADKIDRDAGITKTLIFFGVIILLFGCGPSKKLVDKSSTKQEIQVNRQSSIDSIGSSFETSDTETIVDLSSDETSSYEPHQVDSGQGVVFGNGTAEDYTELPPANYPRKIFLPKNKKVENKKTNTTETKAAAKETEVKKKAVEEIAVKHQQKEVHKDIERSGILMFSLIPLAMIIYLLIAYRKNWFPFPPKLEDFERGQLIQKS